MNRTDLIGRKSSLKRRDLRGRRESRNQSNLLGRVLEDAEIHQLLSAATDEMEKALIAVILGAGVWISDLRNLRLTDINRFGRLTFWRQKNGEKRTVQLSHQVAEILSAYVGQRKDKNPYLFPAPIPSTHGHDWWKIAGNVTADMPMEYKKMSLAVRKAVRCSGMDIRTRDLLATYRERAEEKRAEDEKIEKLVCLLHIDGETAKGILDKYLGKRKNVGLC